MDAWTPAELLDDDAAWDRFVAQQVNPPVSQLTAWARANTLEGWSTTRVVSGPTHRMARSVPSRIASRSPRSPPRCVWRPGGHA